MSKTFNLGSKFDYNITLQQIHMGARGPQVFELNSTTCTCIRCTNIAFVSMIFVYAQTATCLTLQPKVKDFGIDEKNMFEFWDVSFMASCCWLQMFMSLIQFCQCHLYVPGVAAADYISTCLHYPSTSICKTPLLTSANKITYKEVVSLQSCDIILGVFSHTLVVLHATFRM